MNFNKTYNSNFEHFQIIHNLQFNQILVRQYLTILVYPLNQNFVSKAVLLNLLNDLSNQCNLMF